MILTSPYFKKGSAIPLKYTCLGANISPSLTWSGLPKFTQSLFLTITDLDASPQWVHWLVFNIPPATKGVGEGTIPQNAIQGLSNNHTFAYEGPCPKYFTGTHRYEHRLCALDIRLNLPPESDFHQVIQAAKHHILNQAVLIATAQGTLIK